MRRTNLKRTVRGYVRNLGREANGKQPKFYLGHDKAEAERRLNAILVLWQQVEDRAVNGSPVWDADRLDAAKASIAKIAAILAPHQTSKINVNGYTDTTPIGPGLAKQGVTTNLILSQKRADNVMQYMISQGVKPGLVSAHGFGEADPVASNDTAAGKAQNRRVELTIASS